MGLTQASRTQFANPCFEHGASLSPERRSSRTCYPMLAVLGQWWETSRLNFVRLAKAELRNKSSPGMKQLLQDGHAVGSCLHPVNQLINRSNQYAEWKACGKCNATVAYHSKRYQSAKGRGKSRSQMSLGSLLAMAATPEQPDQQAPQGVGSTMTPPRAPTTSSDTNQILQEAVQAFHLQGSQIEVAMQQVGQSLQELARGQSQMLMMMQGPPVRIEPDWPLSAEDMWEEVSPQHMVNPNELEL